MMGHRGDACGAHTASGPHGDGTFDGHETVLSYSIGQAVWTKAKWMSC